MENTAVFIGHRYLPDEAALAPAVRAAVRNLLAAGYRRFLCGGYGSFDRLCAEILWNMKTGMPGVESILVHPCPQVFAGIVTRPSPPVWRMCRPGTPSPAATAGWWSSPRPPSAM